MFTILTVPFTTIRIPTTNLINYWKFESYYIGNPEFHHFDDEDEAKTFARDQAIGCRLH